MRRTPWRDRYAKHIKSKYWAELKSKVVKRRGEMCERCGKDNCSLDMHHLHYRTLGRERQKDVQLLCRECHNIEDEIRKARGDARRIKAWLDKNDKWWDGEFTDAQVCTMIRGGVLDMHDIGHVIDCWDEVDSLGTKLESVPSCRNCKERTRNDLFRSKVRAYYEKHCGSRENVRKRMRVHRRGSDERLLPSS